MYPKTQQHRTLFFFLFPSLAVLCVVAAWPLLRSVSLSLTDASLSDFDAVNYVGLSHYFTLFTDPDWWHAVGNTLKFTLVTVVLETLFGIIIALILNKNFSGRTWVRAAILVPWAIPTIVSAKMWGWMFNDLYGVINALLLKLHLISQPIAWLADPNTIFGSLVFVDVWKTTPFMALLILAGLQNLPHECFEAAKIDGVHPIKVIFRITLPLLKPTIVIAVIFRTLDALRVFDVIYVLIGNHRETISMSMYVRNFLIDYQDVGFGSAAATLVFFIIAIASILHLKSARTAL